MAEFLVEIYVSRAGGDAVAHRAESAQRAARELTAQGTPVRYLSSIFLPEDETCFFLYEAASSDAVREAARRAALPFERVSTAVSASTQSTGTHRVNIRRTTKEETHGALFEH